MTTAEIVAILFGVNGLTNDVQRQALYCKVLKDIPTPLLELAVMKVIDEWEDSFLPKPAIIIKAAKSIEESRHPEHRQKTWGEALEEIEKKMLSTQWGKTPKWSTPEIEKAVSGIGWNNLQTTLAADMPTVRAQLRRLYEDACSRTTEDARNDYLMGKNPKGILGIAEAPKGLQSAGDVLKSIGGAG